MINQKRKNRVKKLARKIWTGIPQREKLKVNRNPHELFSVIDSYQLIFTKQ
jgi:hypothetical protein